LNSGFLSESLEKIFCFTSNAGNEEKVLKLSGIDFTRGEPVWKNWTVA
jgi:hypothetical protein